MRMKYMFIIIVLFFSSKGYCYQSGYSKETCDDLIPNHETGEQNVTVSSRNCPFDVQADRSKYRRNRELEISIINKDVDIKGFQLQFRKSGGDKITRVGRFVGVPKDAKFLQCDEGKNTAVTHEDLEPKSDLKFMWQAPEEDEGTITLASSFVSDGKYWTGCSDLVLECSDFPVSVKDCGISKSCVRHSAGGSDCDGNTCHYLLTYYKSDDRTATFVLSGMSKEENVYIAVGFKREKGGNYDFVTCFKTEEIKQFIVDDQKGLYEITDDLEDQITDKEDDNFWCKFSRPLTGIGNSQLDLSAELEWVYAWGKVNVTTSEPIVEKDKWHKSTHNISELIDEVLTTGASNSVHIASFIPVFLSSLFLIILQM